MQNLDSDKLRRLTARLYAYVVETIYLQRKLENPAVVKREPREARLHALETRIIPGLRDKLNFRCCGGLRHDCQNVQESDPRRGNGG